MDVIEMETFGLLGNGSVDLLEDVPRLNASTTFLDDVQVVLRSMRTT